MNTKSVTLFDWNQFVAQADEINNRAKFIPVISCHTNVTESPQSTTIRLRDGAEVVGTFPQIPIDPMNTFNRTAPDLPQPLGVSTEGIIRKSPDFRLEYGEFIPTPKALRDGWPIWISSANGWLHLRCPPRVILSRCPYWEN